MSKFSREAAEVSRRIAEIGGATLKNIHVHVKTTNMRRFTKGKAYCQTIQACEWKLWHTVYRHHRKGKRRYLLCTNPETCNQQSWEKAIYYDIPK